MSDPGSNLISFSLSTSLEWDNFDAPGFLTCLFGKDVVSTWNEKGEHLAVVPVGNPASSMRFTLLAHKENGEGAHRNHFDLYVALRIHEFDEEPEFEFSDFFRCLESSYSKELDVHVAAGSFYDKSVWKSILQLPRKASGLLPAVPDDTIRLSGVELDLMEANLPLDRVIISMQDDHYYVHVLYSRIFELSADLGKAILAEAVEMTKLFMVQSEESEDDS